MLFVKKSPVAFCKFQFPCLIKKKWFFKLLINYKIQIRNEECPTCMKKLVSTSPDPNFDKLISQIYPNRDIMQSDHQVAYEAMLMSYDANIAKVHFQSVEEESTHKGIFKII